MSDQSGGLTRTIGRAILKTKKNSPHIFFVVGLGGILTSTFLACRATLRLEQTVDDIRDQFSKIENLKIAAEKGGSSYQQDEYVRDLTKAYLFGISKIIKLYGPAAAVGTVSIAFLTGSHVQLSHRNQALTAALAAISQAYDEYRSRVKEEIGEERERAIYEACLLDDPEDEEIEHYREIGKVKNGVSIYARFFEPSNVNWQKDMEYNRIFIECQQNYANHRLRAKGHVFLNEVYDSLGLERSSAGAVVGWVFDNEDGDGFIDFGLNDMTNISFLDGNARGCLLDFNVDGVVFDKI
jgi:Family of unknown function (DUF6353)